MKPRQFVKVISTAITGVDGGKLDSVTARGIAHLKRGVTLLDYVTAFLDERGITAFQLHERADNTWATAPIMFMNQSPRLIINFTFCQFGQDEFGFCAKDLSTQEFDRDMQLLRKFFL
jgi:hypothetical protein